MLNAPKVTEVVLNIGQFYFGGGHTKIRTVLGSCVSITMWHPRRKIGGMCHYMLPHRGAGGTAAAAVEGNYADEVMQMFLRELRNAGTQPRDYIVKLFGGGSMFAGANDAHRPPTDVREVSSRNIAAGRALLADHGFIISTEHTGGYGSRVLVFELWSGDVWIRRGQAVPTGYAAGA
jgi:chemotaxis protein CheD